MPSHFGRVHFSVLSARCSVPKPLSRAGKIGLPPSCCLDQIAKETDFHDSLPRQMKKCVTAKPPRVLD